MISKSIIIPNNLKISLKLSEEISTESSKYKSKVHIKYNDKIYNAKSLLSILSACFNGGEKIEIICDGEDQENALNKIISIFKN